MANAAERVHINWADIDEEGELYKTLLLQLRAPSWHGHNLEALADSVLSNYINGLRAPFDVELLDEAAASDDLRGLALAVREIFAGAAALYGGSLGADAT